jgi:hypothetical protein
MPQHSPNANDGADSGGDEQRDNRPCPNRLLEVVFPTHYAVASVFECVAGGMADLLERLFDRIRGSTSRFPYLMQPCAGVVRDCMDN